MKRRRLLFNVCVLVMAFICVVPVQAGKFTVVIDAGHGGRDGGAIGRHGKEKNINLSVAKRLGELIAKNFPDTKVVYTRKTDVFVHLDRRAAIANNNNADLFISIHANALSRRQSSVYGAETYTLGLHNSEENLEVAKRENSVILIEDDYSKRYGGFNPNSSESYIIFEYLRDKNMETSVRFASMIQQQMKSLGRNNRGVHQAGFLVLREVSMPSVLVELGYVSNENEERYLLSSSGQNQLANGIYRAFCKYRGVTPPKDTIVTPVESDDSNTGTETGSNSGKQKNGQHSSDNSSKEPDSGRKQTANGNVVFKVQILVSTKKLAANDKKFKGLSPISYYKDGNSYKYTYGETSNYNEAIRLQKKARQSFKEAFMVAFVDGERMPVPEARKLVK